MITCPVCHTMNHHLATVCVSCKAYIQQKIENLDLYATIWGLVESPARTFHTISIAVHKNFTLFLSGLAGIGIVIFIFRILSVGEQNDQLFIILLEGSVLGPVAGILLVLAHAGVTLLILRAMGLAARFRNVHAVAAYALVPFTFATVFLIPLDVITFGIYLFTRTPPLYFLNPTSYLLLLTLHGMFIAWGIVLHSIGVKTLMNQSWGRAIAATGLSVGITAGVGTLLVRALA